MFPEGRGRPSRITRRQAEGKELTIVTESIRHRRLATTSLRRLLYRKEPKTLSEGWRDEQQGAFDPGIEWVFYETSRGKGQAVLRVNLPRARSLLRTPCDGSVDQISTHHHQEGNAYNGPCVGPPCTSAGAILGSSITRSGF